MIISSRLLGLLKKNYKEKEYFGYLKSKVIMKNHLNEKNEKKMKTQEELKNLKN
jgi:hypothetical protein